MYRHLFFQRGAIRPHFRLLFESSPVGRFVSPEYRIFEYVKGARVSGFAPPGERVGATLEYVTNQGGLEVLEATSIADGKGVYRFTLPYATLEFSGSIRLQGAYAVTCGERTASLALNEDQVLEGRMVRGPDLRP